MFDQWWHHMLISPVTDCLSLCAADPYADDFRRFATAVPVVTYAINDKTADVCVEKLVTGIWESDITVRTPIGRLRIFTPLIGRNNVYNVLAAVATGLSINVPLKVRTPSSLSSLPLAPAPRLMHTWRTLCKFSDAIGSHWGHEAFQDMPASCGHAQLQL